MKIEQIKYVLNLKVEKRLKIKFEESIKEIAN